MCKVKRSMDVVTAQAKIPSPSKMHSTLKKLLPYTVLLVFLAALMVGEWLYARRIHPDGVTNITEHFERLGPPQQIHRIGRRDGIYYYLSGFPDGHPPLLALPSSPPAYNL